MRKYLVIGLSVSVMALISGCAQFGLSGDTQNLYKRKQGPRTEISSPVKKEEYKPKHWFVDYKTEDDLKEKLRKTKDKLAEARKVIEERGSKIEKLQSINVDLREEVKNLTNKLQSTQEEVKTLQSTVEEKENQIETLQSERKSLRSEKQSLQSELEKTEQELSSLKKKNDRLTEKINSLNDRIDQLESELQTANKEKNELQDKVKSLSKTRDQLEEQLSQQKQTIDDLKSRIDDLQSVKTELSNQVKSLQNKLEDRDSQISSQSDEIKQLEQKVKKLTSTKESLEKKLSELRAELEKARATSEERSSKISQLEQRISELEKEINKSDQTINSLKKELEQQRIEAESRIYKNETLIKDLRQRFSSVTIDKTRKGLHVQFPDRLTFSSGSRKLNDRARNLLDEFSKLLKEHNDQFIIVVGHTDNVPTGSRYSSNWALSGLRSASVVEYLTSERGMKSNRFSISAYGPNRPLFADEKEDSMIQNRRVEFFLTSGEDEASSLPGTDFSVGR